MTEKNDDTKVTIDLDKLSEEMQWSALHRAIEFSQQLREHITRTRVHLSDLEVDLVKLDALIEQLRRESRW